MMLQIWFIYSFIKLIIYVSSFRAKLRLAGKLKCLAFALLGISIKNIKSETSIILSNLTRA